MKLYTLFLSSVVLCLVILAPARVTAEDPLNAVCTGAAATSPACLSRTSENPLLGPKGIITRVIQLIVILTTIISVIVIMIGGFKYIVSSGDPNAVNSAKNVILYAIIGLVISVFAQAIVSLVLTRL